MSLDINADTQRNLWGKSTGFEPQRSDLFYIDFSSAVKGVSAATGLTQQTMWPHYVRSIALPETRTKSDVIRRDSMAYQMPSWDDPLDAIKVVFLLDTNAEDSVSSVKDFLEAWQALTRAGRGSRSSTYTGAAGYLLLNSNYSVNFRFDFNVNLLRGASLTGTQGGLPPTQVMSRLVLHSEYTVKNAWLAAHKIADLAYTESTLVTVEATFYAEDILLGGVLDQQLTGAARLPMQPGTKAQLPYPFNT